MFTHKGKIYDCVKCNNKGLCGSKNKLKMEMRRLISFELLLWITALVLLAMHGVTEVEAADHFSLCPIANMGFSWCPGCGLGRSLSHLLHGEVRQSIQMHWFGIPAVLVLLYRIFILSKQELIKRNLIGKEKYYV
jgi:hypothetical protein